VTEFHGQQDLPKESLAADQVAAAAIAAGLPNVTIERQPEQALQKLMGKAEKIHVITGSFYLLNHVRPIIFGTNPTRERRP
jgi:folylpolyglutamate synthase/dihydropteroate synthase